MFVVLPSVYYSDVIRWSAVNTPVRVYFPGEHVDIRLYLLILIGWGKAKCAITLVSFSLKAGCIRAKRDKEGQGGTRASARGPRLLIFLFNRNAGCKLILTSLPINLRVLVTIA